MKHDPPVVHHPPAPAGCFGRLCYGRRGAGWPAIASQSAPRTSFTDGEIIDGFLKTAFGAEFHLAGRVDRIRKYDRPVRVYIENRGRPDRSTRLSKLSPTSRGASAISTSP